MMKNSPLSKLETLRREFERENKEYRGTPSLTVMLIPEDGSEDYVEMCRRMVG
jgi:hypothetical protein